MVGVAFELGGTAEMALGEEPSRVAAERNRGREKERFARGSRLGLLHVRNDALDGLARAGCDRRRAIDASDSSSKRRREIVLTSSSAA